VLYEGKVVETAEPMSKVHMTATTGAAPGPPGCAAPSSARRLAAFPAGGTEIPTFLSYAAEKKLAKHKEEFGTTGAIEGVAGPEAANNATVTATLIPLLTLGIPTSNTTAILLGAFQNYGIQPARSCSDHVGALVWALIASLYIGNVMLLVLNLPLVGLWVKLLKIPKPQLYAGILIFATVGVYGMRQSAFDLFLLYAIGLLGVVMRRFDFPTAPVVVGMILGPWPRRRCATRCRLAKAAGRLPAAPMSLTLLVIVAFWSWRRAPCSTCSPASARACCWWTARPAWSGSTRATSASCRRWAFRAWTSLSATRSRRWCPTPRCTRCSKPASRS
jgi:putative tricarboxylic transport membrane protein